MADFQDWLRIEIEQSGLSYAEISRRSKNGKGGISHARISQVLSGDPAGPSFCVAIARALRIPTADVLARAGFSVVREVPELAPDEQEAVQLIRAMPPEKRAQALRVLGVL